MVSKLLFKPIGNGVSLVSLNDCLSLITPYSKQVEPMQTKTNNRFFFANIINTPGREETSGTHWLTVILSPQHYQAALSPFFLQAGIQLLVLQE